MMIDMAGDGEKFQGKDEAGMDADGEPEGAGADAGPGENEAEEGEGCELGDEEGGVREMADGGGEDFEAGVPCAGIGDGGSGGWLEEMDE